MRKHRRTSTRRVALAGAGVAALVAGSLTLANANASESPSAEPRTLSSAAAATLAQDLVSGLAGDAGAYYDSEDRTLVVNVVDEEAAEKVESAGAEARVVEHTMAQLTAVKEMFTARDMTGTSRMVDPVTNKVVVTADSTVTGAEYAQLEKQVAAEDGKAVLKRTEGEYTTRIAGGDAIFGPSGRCSLGFNVTVDGRPGFLTAGHCTNAISSWAESQGGPEIARTQSGSFPGDDFGLAMYTAEVDRPGEVNLYDGSSQPISGAGEATVGQTVQRSGSTTQLHDGEVTGLDVSVSYPEGTVDGLIQTTVCAEPGDSGGALFAGDQALGLTSGGSGDCTSGGETFFQPVGEALQAFGAQLG
ncbi:S1 family peptidase [Streptomyces sp. JJ36]|uniref:S1 family peptidase n=1 Tax=Streptomyces sp. JJ36 TaxID=2736645 RepID=UPI001F47AB50|nr:S1 family peptidase [Streptomyces sp. JJ36]MCF6522478.1 S1 family peptidase [Streptomyces sp. JJ36]